ncbi:LytR/AlgR family response regulator transcription factor [Ectobacillus funiculus]|uniref:LytR/AlgR family response regulator transcription factor n=1 Tax=Ectobacillus funiculus TaxID=137993 RepID=UPI00101DF060|nr:LytTR family transcriptional regulator DNA-binding domain-containing protein [Ectobacillus funiculus]
MFKAFIVDDELLAREELKYVLRRGKQVEIVGEAETAEEALEQVVSLQPDLVFLDIQLSDESGLDVAKRLKELQQPSIVVFVTAYDEHALQAFELNALDYILKPFDESRIEQALEKIKRIKQPTRTEFIVQNPIRGARTGKLAIEADERIVLADMEYIVFIGLVDGKTVIKTLEQQYAVNDALITIEKKLPHDTFMRVHRAFIINLKHIVEMEPWFHSTYNLTMKDGSKVPVSRTYMKELKEVLGLHCKKL